MPPQGDIVSSSALARGKVWSFDPESKPPPFGHSMKPYFGFHEKNVSLNHGSYGSLPLPVFSECSKIQYEAEERPDWFHRITYMPLLKESRRLVAELVGAEHDEIVLVANATTGINTILRNFEWKDGDILFGASTTYGAVMKTLQYIGDRSAGPKPTVYAVEYTFPMKHSEIIDATRAKIRELKQAHPESDFTDTPQGDGTAPRKNKFVAIIDSIVSNPGVLLPWKEIVQVCREEGVWSVIDAAHSIGQEVGINLSEAQPDFWASNCHKWLYAKRGCAALYVPKRNQYLIKSSVPTSHSYIPASDSRSAETTAFVDQHEWTGTIDFSPFLSVTHALNFRKWLGGEEVINAYCHNLAVAGGKRLAEILGTRVMDETGELTLNMINILLPLPVEVPGEKSIYDPELNAKIHATLDSRLMKEWDTYVASFYHGGAWWCRGSAQVWNELSDFEYVGGALNSICSDIRETLNSRGSFGNPEEGIADRSKAKI